MSNKCNVQSKYYHYYSSQQVLWSGYLTTVYLRCFSISKSHCLRFQISSFFSQNLQFLDFINFNQIQFHMLFRLSGHISYVVWSLVRGLNYFNKSWLGWFRSFISLYMVWMNFNMSSFCPLITEIWSNLHSESSKVCCFWERLWSFPFVLHTGHAKNSAITSETAD